VYYDIGNSTRAGHDAVKEIRWLGAGRIAQIHLKQHPPTNRLSEGSVDLQGVCAAIREIGFRGFANLETRALPDTVERDIGQDLAYLRGLRG
jgi:sugar phosphate isomerase/epimerase